MSYPAVFKNVLLGSSLPQEYLCVNESLSEQFSVTFSSKNPAQFIDISHRHTLLGYKPLVIGLVAERSTVEADWLSAESNGCFSFGNGQFSPTSHWNGLVIDQRSVARLMMKKLQTLELGDSQVSIWQGEFGENRLLSPIHQMNAKLMVRLRRQLPGNVALPGNLYDQVIAAYAVPRAIVIATVSKGERMNLFPTDLHGPVGHGNYLDSLRMGGKANDQVEEVGHMALSRMPVSLCKWVYESGRNHMADWRSKTNFRLSPVSSRHYGIPLPEGVLSSLELRKTGSLDVGIHRIHTFEIVGEEDFTGGMGLAHIHRWAAQWRLNHHLETEMFFR